MHSTAKQPARLMIKWVFGCLLAIIMTGSSGALQTASATPVNLVQNGNFLSTSVTGNGGYLCVNSGTSCTSQLSNWGSTCSTSSCNGSSTPGSILMAGTNGSAFNGGMGLTWTGSITPPGGGNVVAIDGGPSYTSLLTQTITGLQVGQTYELQFYQASAEQGGFNTATTEQWSASLGGGTAQTGALMSTPAGGQTSWTQQTLMFVASATSEALQFAASGNPGNDPPIALIGDVDLFQVSQTSVPEPASLALVLAGAAGVFGARRRLAKQSSRV